MNLLMTCSDWAPGYPKSHDEDQCRHTKCNRCTLLSTTVNYIPFKSKDSVVEGLVQQNCAVKNQYICKRANITGKCSNQYL